MRLKPVKEKQIEKGRADKAEVCSEDSQDRILQREEMTLADQSQSSHNIVGNQQLINSCGEHTVHTKDKKKKERKQLLQREEQDDLRDVTPAGDLSRVTWLNHP